MIRKLRPDQKNVVGKALKTTKGQIIRPTGSGKGVVAMEIIRKTAPQVLDESVDVVFVPRIMLGKQWILKCGEYLIGKHGMPYNFVNVNSGHLSQRITNKIDEALYKVLGPGVVNAKSVIDPDSLQKRVFFLHAKGYRVLLIVTYHSSHILERADLSINVIIYDEPQFLPENNEFLKSITEIIAARKYFTGATPKFTHSAHDSGMNNEDLYGPVIDEVKPKTMIEKGVIVEPCLHIVGTSMTPTQLYEREKGVNLAPREYNALTRMIFESHEKHKMWLQRTSADPSRLGAKMLVVVNGQLPLQGIFSSSEFKKLCKNNPQIHIFGLSTDFGIYYDGRKHRVSDLNKENFLLALQELPEDADAIVFHVDMIGEGLDVPGLTTLMPLRNLGKIKFLQNLGRTTRLHPEDRKRMEDGALKLSDWNGRIKPHCSIILPYCIDHGDDFLERNVDLIDSLRTEYDFDPSEQILVDMINPWQKGPEFNEDKLVRQIRASVGDKVVRFYHEMEDKSMTVEELVFISRLRGCLERGDDTIITKIARRGRKKA